jgi:hypothetical protein
VKAAAGALAAAIALAVPVLGTGAVYAGAGVRAKNVTVCFVGEALAKRPDRVQQVLTYLQEIEFAANVRFTSLGTCPPSVPRKNGNDWFDGDIRVVLEEAPAGTSLPGWPGPDGTGPVPGNGCRKFITGTRTYDHGNDTWSSWSDFPNDLNSHRPCLYNLKLGKDAPPGGAPYLNHTLHEFGHALGLAHEHERTDVNDPSCTEAGYGGNISSGFLTPYDRNSVMHYQFPSCGINGNYDYTGLSAWDQLALHILYPESPRVAEFVGTTVYQTGDTISLQSAWEARGANMSFVARDFQWFVNAAPLSTTPDLTTTITSPGDYQVVFAYTDFLGRRYGQEFKIHVLTPETYAAQIAGPAAALSVLAG